MVEDRVSRIAGGAVAKLDNEFIRILVYAPNILRITFSPDDSFWDQSPVVIAKPVKGGYTIEEHRDMLSISSRDVEARLDIGSGILRIRTYETFISDIARG